MHKVLLLGDSIMAHKAKEEEPETGWGDKFQPYLKDGYVAVNMAKNGRSTESFILEGLFFDAVQEASDGDYAIISFGHNDSKPDAARRTEPWTTYPFNLKYMVGIFKEKGTKCIFVSSLARRKFLPDGTLPDTHGDYPKAMEKTARELSIPFVELSESSRRTVEEWGDEKSREYYMILSPGECENFPEGKFDTTHLKPKGAEWVAKTVADELRKQGVEFIG